MNIPNTIRNANKSIKLLKKHQKFKTQLDTVLHSTMSATVLSAHRYESGSELHSSCCCFFPDADAAWDVTPEGQLRPRHNATLAVGRASERRGEQDEERYTALVLVPGDDPRALVFPDLQRPRQAEMTTRAVTKAERT